MTRKKRPEELVKYPGDSQAIRVPPDVVDAVCAKALSDGVPKVENYFPGAGWPMHFVRNAVQRVQERGDDAHPDDVYLVKTCERVQKQLENRTLKKAMAGNRMALEVLKVVRKEYNPEYLAAVQSDVTAMLRVVGRIVSPEQYVAILTAITEMGPNLELPSDVTTPRRLGDGDGDDGE